MKEEEKIAVCSKFPSKLCRENIGMGVRQTVSKHKQNTFYPKVGQHRTTNISTEDEDMRRKFKGGKQYCYHCQQASRVGSIKIV